MKTSKGATSQVRLVGRGWLDVRFSPNSDCFVDIPNPSLRAKSGLMHRSKSKARLAAVSGSMICSLDQPTTAADLRFPSVKNVINAQQRRDATVAKSANKIMINLFFQAII